MFLQHLCNSKNNSLTCTVTDQAYDANGYTSENQAFIFIQLGILSIGTPA